MLMIQTQSKAFCHFTSAMRSKVTPKAVLLTACPMMVPMDDVLMSMCMRSSQEPFDLPVAYSTVMKISVMRRDNWKSGENKFVP